MRLEAEYINKLRDLPIEQVAQRLGLELHHGKTFCLWHQDKHPSLTIDRRRNRVKCWACGKSADTIELVMKSNNLSFREACEWLADSPPGDPPQPSLIGRESGKYVYRSYPVDVEWLCSLVRYPYLNSEAQHFLFEERRIDPRVVRWCGLSSINTPMPCYRGGKPFFEAPSLLIPYRDINGNLLTVQSRYLGKRTTEEPGSLPKGRAGGESSGSARFRYPRGSNCPIFNLPVLQRLSEDETLYIAEGVSDCLAMLSAGHKAIAIGSATLLRDDDLIAALGPLRPRWHGDLCMCPDNDAPGEALYQQVVGISLRLGVPLRRLVLPEGYKDFGGWFATGSPRGNSSPQCHG